MNLRLFIFAAICVLGVGAAFGETQWTTVATLTANGTVQEINIGQKISKVTVTCIANSVTITSIEVINSEQNYVYHVGNKLSKDQTQQITVGKSLMCQTLKITDEGTGTYEVRVKD